jgi:hypothetical protein
MPAPTFSPQRARALREHRHLSREVLAARIGKTPGAVEKFERGGVAPVPTPWASSPPLSGSRSVTFSMRTPATRGSVTSPRCATCSRR